MVRSKPEIKYKNSVPGTYREIRHVHVAPERNTSCAVGERVDIMRDKMPE